MRKGISTQAILLTGALLMLAPGAQASSTEGPTLWARVEQQVERTVSHLLVQLEAAAYEALHVLSTGPSGADPADPSGADPALPIPSGSSSSGPGAAPGSDPVGDASEAGLHAEPEDPTTEVGFPQIDPNG